MLLGVLMAALTVSAQDIAPEKPMRYLLVGDSMAWGLALEMKPLVKARGDVFRSRTQVNDSIRGYANRKRIRADLQKYRPDVVLVALGANDVHRAKPEGLAPYVEKIVGALGQRECYWIGPPMWKDDNGLVQVLQNNTGPCRFFDSSPLELSRRRDGIHPNREGSRVWAEAVVRWIEEKHAAP